MTEAALPASVNWFYAHAVHVAHEGAEPLLATAAKHLVFVAKLARKKPEYAATLVGFKKGSKVAALCFGRSSDGQSVLLAAAGRELCVWPLQSVLGDAGPVHKSTRVAGDVRALAACAVHEGRFYVGTEQGQVLAVRVNGGLDVSAAATSSASDVLQATAPVSVLSTCCQQLTIGMTTGVVAIASVDAFPAYTMLGTHSDDVQSMAWCASGRRLITSSRDQRIKIWDTTTLQLVQEISMDKRSANVPYNRLWISVAVVKRPRHSKAAEKGQKEGAEQKIEQKEEEKQEEEEEEELLVADPVGKMFTISLDALQPTADTEAAVTFRKAKDVTERSFEHKHSRPVFQLVACRNREWVLSVSMDRDVALWDVKSGKRLWVMHGFGGFIYSLADSPLGLVIGAGDNMVRRWDHTYSSRETVQVWWKGLKSTVTCVLPHPEEHSLVAVGDEAGRVCLLNTLNNQVATTAAPHRAPISQLAWFAVKAAEEGGGSGAAAKFELLSLCADGRLKCQQRLVSADEDCTDRILEQLVPGSTGAATKLSSVAAARAEIAASPSSLMACGTTTGAAGVFEFDQVERSWQLRAGFNDQVSAVTCCDICRFSNGGSGTSHDEAQIWVATGGADGRVFVHTLRESALAASASGVIDSSASVRGAYRHIRRVNDVKLCAASSGSLLLASASDDWSVQIWDCLRQTHVFSYRKHAGSVRCLAWAWEQSGRSVLFSGSEDQSVHKWSVEGALASSATPPIQPPTVQEIQQEKRKVGEDVRTTQDQPPEQKLASTTTTITSSSRAASGLTATAAPPPTTTASPASTAAAVAVTAPAPAARRKPKKPPRWLALNAGSPESSATATGNFLKFIGSPAAAAAADGPIDAALLRTRDESDQCVQQVAEEREQASPELAASTLLLKGDLIGAFDLVLKHDLVTAEWVALAPALGPGMWDQVMRRYIAKLEASGEIDAAVRAALAFGDPQWAVDLCLGQRWFHEAVAIARSHSFDDGATNDILRAWATALDQGGQSEQAARVFWAASDFEAAVVALTRKGTLPGLLAALEAFETEPFASSPAWPAAQFRTFTLMAIAKAASLGDLSVVVSILASQHDTITRQIERADAATISLGAVSGVCQFLDHGNAVSSIKLPEKAESKFGAVRDLLPNLSTDSSEQLQHLSEVVGFLHDLCSKREIEAEVENGAGEAAAASMAAARDKLAACVGRGIVTQTAVSRADSIVQCMAQWQEGASTKIAILKSFLAGVEPAQDRDHINSSTTKLLCGIWLHWAIDDAAIRQLDEWQTIARHLFTN